MARLMLSAEQWSKLKEIVLQHQIYNKPNLRMIVEAMLYRWSSKDKLMKIFKALVQNPDLEWEFIDGSVVRAHQHSSGAAREENQAIGKSVGGNTTKIHMAVDAYGLPM